MLSVIQRSTLVTRCLGSTRWSGYTSHWVINIGQVRGNIYHYAKHKRHRCLWNTETWAVREENSIQLIRLKIAPWWYATLFQEDSYLVRWCFLINMDSMPGLHQQYLLLTSITGNKGECWFGKKGKINTAKIIRVVFWRPEGIWGGGWRVGKGEPGAGPSAVRLFVVWAVWTSQRLTALTLSTQRDCSGKLHHRVIINQVNSELLWFGLH